MQTLEERIENALARMPMTIARMQSEFRDEGFRPVYEAVNSLENAGKIKPVVGTKGAERLWFVPHSPASDPGRSP